MKNIKLYKAEGVTQDQSPNAGKIFPQMQPHDKYLDSDMTFTDITDITEQNKQFTDIQRTIQTRSETAKKLKEKENPEIQQENRGDKRQTRQQTSTKTNKNNQTTEVAGTPRQSQNTNLITGRTTVEVHKNPTNKHTYNLRNRK